MNTTKHLIEFDAEKLCTAEERRGFLGKLALAAGAFAVAPLILRGERLSASMNSTSATCNNPELGGWSEREMLTDLQILNFALVLEYLEATFYVRADNRGRLPGRATLRDIDPDGRGRPGRVRGLDKVLHPPLPANAVVQFVRKVRDHEIEHVLFLQSALGDLALPRSIFEFDFGGAYSSPEAFLAVAQTLEDVGVTAYLGQVGNIDDAGILAAAGSIAGVEAEHAAGFRLINGAPITPDNNAFDMRRTSSEVIDLAGGFITMPDPLPAPMDFPGG